MVINDLSRDTLTANVQVILGQDHFTAFNQILMREFGIWQRLLYLVSLDREGLLDCDLRILDELTRRKNSEWNALTACQTSRQDLMQLIQLENDGNSGKSLEDTFRVWLGRLPANKSERLLTLSKSIQAFGERFNEIVQENYLLADHAQSRLWGLSVRP